MAGDGFDAPDLRSHGRWVERLHGALHLEQIDALHLRPELSAQARHVERGRVKAHVVPADHAHAGGPELARGLGRPAERDHPGHVHWLVRTVEEVLDPDAPTLEREPERGGARACRGRDQRVTLAETAEAVEDDRPVAESEQDARRGAVFDPVDDVGDKEVPARGAQLANGAFFLAERIDGVGARELDSSSRELLFRLGAYVRQPRGLVEIRAERDVTGSQRLGVRVEAAQGATSLAAPECAPFAAGGPVTATFGVSQNVTSYADF